MPSPDSSSDDSDNDSVKVQFENLYFMVMIYNCQNQLILYRGGCSLLRNKNTQVYLFHVG